MTDSKFVEVVCPECGHKQRTFTHASTTVKCLKCNAVIAKPSGGKAVIKGKVKKVLG
jgi:small subunit ribosomal protein S27e